MNVTAPSASQPTYGQAAGVNARAGQGPTARSSGQPDAEEQQIIAKLAARDREVRQHEQAHLSAAGGLAMSGASYTYQRGPDGKNYAIGGEVSIDVSPGRTPEETIAKAERIRAAALAPANPSGQDRAVAAQAASMAQEAQAEKARDDRENQPGDGVDRKFAVNRAYAAKTDEPTGQLIQAWA